MKALLDRFDAQAETAGESEAIDAETAAVKSAAAKRAGLDAPEPVPTSQARFRTEPDTVIPIAKSPWAGVGWARW